MPDVDIRTSRTDKWSTSRALIVLERHDCCGNAGVLCQIASQTRTFTTTYSLDATSHALHFIISLHELFVHHYTRHINAFTGLRACNYASDDTSSTL